MVGLVMKLALADRRELYDEQVNINDVRVGVGALFLAQASNAVHGGGRRQ